MASMKLRAPEVEQKYADDRRKLREKYGDDIPCAMCARPRHTILHSTETMVVTVNDYPYSIFDRRAVAKHLLLTPKRHEASMANFTAAERRDYIDMMALYHEKGYASMTRSLIDTERSVPLHIHTHLMKYTGGII